VDDGRSTHRGLKERLRLAPILRPVLITDARAQVGWYNRKRFCRRIGAFEWRPSRAIAPPAATLAPPAQLIRFIRRVSNIQEAPSARAGASLPGSALSAPQPFTRTQNSSNTDLLDREAALILANSHRVDSSHARAHQAADCQGSAGLYAARPHHHRPCATSNASLHLGYNETFLCQYRQRSGYGERCSCGGFCEKSGGSARAPHQCPIARPKCTKGRRC